MVLILGIISVVILIFIFIISPIVTVVAGAAMLIGYALWRFIKRGCKFRKHVNLIPEMRWSPKRWLVWWIILTVAMFLLGLADCVLGEEGNSIIFGEGNGEYLLWISIMFMIFTMASPLIGNFTNIADDDAPSENDGYKRANDFIDQDLKSAKTKFCPFDYLMTLFDKYGVTWYDEAGDVRVLTKEQLRDLRDDYFALEKERKDKTFNKEKFDKLKEDLKKYYKLNIDDYEFSELPEVKNGDMCEIIKTNFITKKIYDALSKSIGRQQERWHSCTLADAYLFEIVVMQEDSTKLEKTDKNDDDDYNIPYDVPF